MKTNKKGFTLIELLAVIVILGLLMAIAIPSITKYITESRRKTLAKTIDSYISSVAVQVSNGEYHFTGTKVTYGSEMHYLFYAVPIECIALEKGGSDPFGNWMQANKNYFGYVIVRYDNENYNYQYGFTFKDDAGYAMYPTLRERMSEDGKEIRQKLSVTKPENGSIVQTADVTKWNWPDVSNADYIQVLTAVPEGVETDGSTTCTIQQKGSNYDEVMHEQDIANNKDDYTLRAIEANTTVAFWQYRSQIKTATFQDSINIPDSVPDNNKWDVSVTGNGKVMAYVVPQASNPSAYDLYIQGDGKVYANPDSSFLFDEFRNLDRITLNNFDTSRVVSMAGMFYAAGYNSTIFTIDLGNNFDTSNVKNMNQIFNQMGYKSTNFKLDLGDKFNTENVTDMYKAFWKVGYSSPSFTIDLGNKFDTSNVTRMNYMFGNMGYKSTVLTLNLGDKFNTSNVTEMSEMFQDIGANSPSFHLDCSSWDVNNVAAHNNFYTGSGGKVIPPNWVTP